MEKKTFKIGFIGMGTVAQGVWKHLENNRAQMVSRFGSDYELAKACVRDVSKKRAVAIPAEKLTENPYDIVNDPSIDIVCELMGGTTAAFDITVAALKAGKVVVSANKAVICQKGAQIFEAAEKSGGAYFFEASVAGGIPIIKALREGLVSNRIHRIYGIMNGTCNYILTRMENEGADFNTVLADAQKLGYAEANPSLDIDGFDTAHKTAILAALAFGEWFGLDPVHVEGIRDLELADLRYAEELGYRIKLLSVIKESEGNVQMSVRPTLIPRNTLLANISDVFNGVLVEGDTVGQTLFYGRGAGRNATASAVVADLTDVAINLAIGSVRRTPAFRPGKLFRRVLSMEESSSRFYLRLQVRDCPGVIASIAQILADKSISISSLIQHERREADGTVALVILTHSAAEKSLRAALAELATLSINQSPVKLMRIEDI